jgi:hypothetical protein
MAVDGRLYIEVGYAVLFNPEHKSEKINIVLLIFSV